LGRNLLIGPGGEVPSAWNEAEKVGIDAARPDPSVLDALSVARAERRRIVVEVEGALPTSPPTLNVAFHELDPLTDLPDERLVHLLLANSVDLRDPEAPRCAPVERAISLGALCEGPADVLVADTPMWCDGGPLAPIAGLSHGLIPAAHLLAGRLIALQKPRRSSADLAPDQVAAVEHAGGPCRIVAPAGSGKTRVLTERTRHLIEDWGLDPGVLGLVAYNRRARDEIAERTNDLRGLEIRTLNSLALAIATGTGGFGAGRPRQRRETIDERTMRRILDGIVPSRRRRALTDPLEPWIDALSAARLGLRDPAEVEGALGTDITGFTGVCSAYRDELESRNLLDFDEQILAAIEVLLTDPEQRAAARRAAPVLLVDEFQDLTPAHVLLIRLLAGPAAEVVGVGDDDQTIYGFAGANPSWLIDYGKLFPGAADHPLQINHRCPPDVVDAAVNLLSHNLHRVTKQISASPTRTPVEGELITVTSPDPSRVLVDAVKARIAEGVAPGDIAILARVRAALLPAMVGLRHAGIGVSHTVGVGPSVLQRAGVGAALAWLRLAIAPERALGSADVSAALRRPPRSLHPRILDWAGEQASVSELRSLAGRLRNDKDQMAVGEFADQLAAIRTAADRGASTAELFTMIVDEVGLGRVAGKLDQVQRVARRAAHSDELAAIAEVARLQPDPERFETWLAELLDQPGDPAGINLATVHATKGLEWPVVIVTGADEHLFPHHLALDVEEERRVMHVAITRASDRLLVISGPRPSPFLVEFDEARAANGVPTVSTRRDPAARAASRPASTAPARRSADDDNELESALRSWRRTRASDDGVPPYVVFPDATLRAIAEQHPTSTNQLGSVPGIGPSRLDKYGADILALLETHR